MGVIGHPIGHSLSPRMHNAAFSASGLDYVYVPMDVKREDLPDAVRGLEALGFRGFNVTMPHKETIGPLLDELDEAARVSGAVNTVLVGDRGMRGMNTDGSGFLKACAEAGVDFGGRRVLVVGAGGAAAAICFAVLGEGVNELQITNRSPERAERLAGKLQGEYPGTRILTVPFEAREGVAREAEVLINTTYLGMKDEDPLPVSAEVLKGREAVCDAVYSAGEETRIVSLARKAGARVVTGERMLLYQGAQAQETWTGVEPDVEAMSNAIF